MGWNSKSRYQGYPSEIRCNVNIDQHGTTKTDHWVVDWSSNKYLHKRYVTRKCRIAGKLMVKHELFQYQEWLLELDDQYADEHWYDDEKMELPDWWYGVYPEPEIEDDIYYDNDDDDSIYDHDHYYSDDHW